MKYTQYRPLIAYLNIAKSAGFTLLEMMIVLVIIGILGAIAAPSWNRFRAERQTTMARDELHQGLRQAQAASLAQRSSWRFSLRQQTNHWEWAVHPDTQNASDVEAWQSLDANVLLEASDTTLAQRQGIYYVRFGYRGDVKYRLGTVTVTSRSGLAQNRCVVVSTLLGATRKGREHLYPNGNGRYCY